MSTHRDPDRLVHDFLMEGQTELADQVFDAVRATIEHKNQRDVIGPWRIDLHEQVRALGLGTAAVVAAVVIGTLYFGARVPGGVGAPPSHADTGDRLPHPARRTAADHRRHPRRLDRRYGHPREGRERGRPAGWRGECHVRGPLYVYGDPCRWSSTRPDVPATTWMSSSSHCRPRPDATPARPWTSPRTGMPGSRSSSMCRMTRCSATATTANSRPGAPIRSRGRGATIRARARSTSCGSWTWTAPHGHRRGVLRRTPAADVEEMRAIVESATFTSPS